MKCLVVVLDACQPAYLGCYGNDWLVTPTLDELASHSVVFDQHFAPEPTPSAVRWNWLTGRWLLPDAATGRRRFPRLPQLLWEHDIATVLIGDERSPSRNRLPGRGWEAMHWIRQCRVGDLEQESPLGGTVQTAVEWLKTNQGLKNWLVWLELASLRAPWHPSEFDKEALEGHPEADLEPLFDPPLGQVLSKDIVTAEPSEAKSLVERAAATYAGVVYGVDQWLGMLLDQVRELGMYDELLIVITSDVGWPLGQHGVVGDQPAHLHEELIHLPLVVKLPNQEQAGRRVQQLTLAVDLMPTLAEAFGIPVPESVHGFGLLSTARGQPLQRREYICSHSRIENADQWLLRTHEWCLRLSGQTGQLFVKPEDRWEVNDVANLHPEVAEHLELTLRRFAEVLRQDRLDLVPLVRRELLRLAQ
ncbi:MAG: sulfatase [Gemmatales bacterium]|nr:sulfatase [Gemmatales bacterium]MDW8385511.1 sulfatase [Gemmatales bacterium]